MTDWSIEQARRAYNVAHWADSYFDIDVHGQLVVQAAGQVVSIKTLVDDLRTRGFALPVLLRFTDILADRVRRLAAAFDEAIAEQAYSGAYTPVFPIKVNQQRSVVRQIVAQDPHCHGGVGLEAGSKPELMAVLALSKPGGVVVCNGYKDRHYVRLALLGRRLGLRVYIVVEKRSELERVITEARNLGVKPLLG
ncbi:MAG: arginine decarboxylase, partial [Xanthomonadales bacterium]|nr:arginine decarboxylase [Xanthomonadales bacterium]